MKNKTYPWLGALCWLLSGAVSAQAYSGKVVIDGVVVGDSNANVVEGNGRLEVQRRTLPCFSQITVEAGVDLVYRRGRNCEVKIEADSNLVPVITTDVRGNRLIIDSNRSFQTSSPIRVEVSSPDLELVEIQGSSDVVLDDVDAKTLKLQLYGSGGIEGRGRAGTLDIIADGSGTLNLRDLLAENVSVVISGAADAAVHARRSLRVDIDGAGDVTYYGNPAQVEKNISGAGDVQAGE